MGFLEIAAAMKFLSSADLIWHWSVFTRTAVLCIWAGCTLMIAAHLLGWLRLDHDGLRSSVSGVEAAFALSSLAASLWLMSGVVGGGLGTLEAFLPPAASQRAVLVEGAAQEQSWILNDLPKALALARAENKPVFVDFTGYTCTNCRWMEANIFTRPEIQDSMNRFVRVRLYTDGAGKVFSDQQKYEEKHFGTVALPLYALLDSTGATVGTSAGITRDPREFSNFLHSAP